MVFFEDDVRPKKQTTTPRVVDLNPIPYLIDHDNHGGDESSTEDASREQGDEQPPEHDGGDVDEDAEIDDTLEGQQQEQLRRTSRASRPSTRYPPHEYVMLTDNGEPSFYEEAMSDQHKDQWLEAMQDEINSLYKNNTYELVNLPKDKKALKNKWVYRLKTEEDSSHPWYTTRLVVKGFGQKQGVDFDEIFYPMVKMSSVRVVLGMAATMDLEIEQLE